MNQLDQIKQDIVNCRTYNFGMWIADRLAHDEAPKLVDALDAVLARHIEDDQGKCAECTVAPFSIHSVRYPCPTVTAIAEALS